MPNKLITRTRSLLTLSLLVTTSVATGGTVQNGESEDLNLPVHHLPFYYQTSSSLNSASSSRQSYSASGSGQTESNNVVVVKNGQEEKEASPDINPNYCWGYEDDCDFRKPFSFSYPHPIPFQDEALLFDPERRLPYSGPIPSTIDESRTLFYAQADFGYVKAFRNSLRPVCKAQQQHINADADTDQPGNTRSSSSSLECSELFGFCRAQNIIIDFRHLVNRTTPIIYDTNVLQDGDIGGGHCDLDQDFIKENSRFESSLTTWGPELKHFRPIMSKNWSINAEHCDVIIDKPTFVMKLDATTNMYHHFCDFFNLYATLFVNATTTTTTTTTHKIFDPDINILIWRSWYRSSFDTTFDAFTRHPLMTLADYFGKRVCFRDVVFSLLPRMVAGLFYSTPVVPGYRGSGLFRAFSDFILHRLQIPSYQTGPIPNKLRVTFLSRRTTLRRILNEDEIIREIQKNNSHLIVNKVEFTEKTDFKEQLTIIQNTDILIGIHGAGLSHLLFLPKWAVVFEIYHCEDPNCYSELSRFAGVQYMTWENVEKLEAKQISANLDVPEYYHKHANYVFDINETVRLTNKAAYLVIKNSDNAFVNNVAKKHDEL